MNDETCLIRTRNQRERLSIYLELIHIRAPKLNIPILIQICLLIFYLFHHFIHSFLFSVCYLIFFLRWFLTWVIRITGRILVWTRLFSIQFILTMILSFMFSSPLLLVIPLIFFILNHFLIGNYIFLIRLRIVLTTTSPLYYLRKLPYHLLLIISILIL